MAGRPIKRRTCAWPVVLGLSPKRKNHPLGGWIIIFNIGIKKMRRLAEENMGVFALVSGNRYLIIRTKFEEYLQNNSTI